MTLLLLLPLYLFYQSEVGRGDVLPAVSVQNPVVSAMLPKKVRLQ